MEQSKWMVILIILSSVTAVSAGTCSYAAPNKTVVCRKIQNTQQVGETSDSLESVIIRQSQERTSSDIFCGPMFFFQSLTDIRVIFSFDKS